MAGSSAQCTAFNVVGMLLTGTMNTLTTKIQFTMSSVGVDGAEKKFLKPWFGTFNMLLAMLLVGIVDKAWRCASAARKRGAHSVPLIDSSPALGPRADPPMGEEIGRSYRCKVLLVAIPAAFDLLATALCCMGILYIPASVWQMLRGTSIIFAALLSITFLRRTMYAFNYLGLSLCVLGVTLVGASNVLGTTSEPDAQGEGEADETSRLILGMSLVVSGQVVQAAQVIAEEWLMKDVDLPAMQIIGFEGFWGFLMMILIVYPALYLIPGSDNGHMEDPIDTFVMIQNNPDLLKMMLLYLFSCGTFNATGIAVTGALSAVFRMMLDASRTTIIWGFGLTVHYYVDANSPFGELWTPYSYMQLFGFLILVSGQAVYGGVVKVPGMWYPEPAAAPPVCSPGSALLLTSPLPPERDQQM